MSYALWLAFFYVFGGITFVPLVCLGIIVFLYWYLPKVELPNKTHKHSTSEETINTGRSSVQSTEDTGFRFPSVESLGSLSRSTDSKGNLHLSNASTSSISSEATIPSLSIEREAETGVDAQITGWLTVSTEYFIYPTGGTNTVSYDSNVNDTSNQVENAYSTLYNLMRSKLKDESSAKLELNGKPLSVSVPRSNSNTKKPKMTKYFAVLRHGNLFLYEGSDQKDVKHVIVIANYVVSIWPPDLRDGELFGKRNAICLAKIPGNAELSSDSDFQLAEMLADSSKPPKNAYYLYSDIILEKEDFYFSLIRASKRHNLHASVSESAPLSNSSLFDPVYMAHPFHYKTTEMIDLIQTLHSTDANIQTRWLNAILGRIFLSIKGTSAFENFFRNKLVTKLSRSKRPSFLSEIKVTNVSSGDSIPIFTNPRLIELSPEGKLMVDVDLVYSGNFSIEVTTNALINLGSRFKTREVPIALSITLQRIEGKLILKMKPPPSGRLWYTFETSPKISLRVEPIVSSRQITYSMITNAIENRIREAINESLVAPNFNDVAFFSTEGELFRGGIWETSTRPSSHAEIKSNSSDLSNSQRPSPPCMQAAEIENSKILVSKVKESKKAATLRQRKSTPELRASSTAISDESFPMPSITKSLMKKGLHQHKSSDSLRSAFLNKSSVPFDINDHIGELHNLNLDTDFSKKGLEIADSKPTLAGTVKKWGSWYFKERVTTNTEDMGNKSANSSRLHRHASENFHDINLPKSFNNGTTANELLEQSSKDHIESKKSIKSKSKPVNAPIPHSFPPGILDSLSSHSGKSSNFSTSDKLNQDQHFSTPRESTVTPLNHPLATHSLENLISHENFSPRVKQSQSLQNLLAATSRPKDDDQKKIEHIPKDEISTLAPVHIAAAEMSNPPIIKSKLGHEALITPKSTIPKSATVPSLLSTLLPSISKSESFPGTQSLSANDNITENGRKLNLADSLPKSPLQKDTHSSKKYATLHKSKSSIDRVRFGVNQSSTITNDHLTRTKSFGSVNNPGQSQIASKEVFDGNSESLSYTFPSLDQVPIELAGGSSNSTFVESPTFSVPLLAPPPPMRERTIAKRGSNDNLRRGTRKSSGNLTGSNIYASSHESRSVDSVIAVPIPASTATPYTYEQSLNDFLLETAAKFESTAIFDNLLLDQKRVNNSESYSSSSSVPTLDPKTHHNEETRSVTGSSITAGSVTAFNPSDPTVPAQPILSYRKGKPKRPSQGFKFF